jgi:hypothetical protein
MSAVLIKNRVVVSIFLTAALAVAGASAFADGGANGGGGSNDRPTPEEVKAEVFNMITIKPEGPNPFYRVVGSDPGDPELRALFKRMDQIQRVDLGHGSYRVTSMVAIDLEKTPFIFKEKGACHGDQEASVQKNELFSPICFSLEKIIANTPRAGLRNAVASLLGHEVAHQFGADETLAKKTERYFSSPAAQNQESYNSAKINLQWMMSMLSNLKSNLDNGFYGAPRICAELGKIQQTNQNFAQLYDGLPVKPKEWEALTTTRGDDFFSRNAEMLGYCGERWSSAAIAEGDKKALRESVGRLIDELGKVGTGNIESQNQDQSTSSAR